MEAKLQRTREVHDTLLPVLADTVGDNLKVEKSVNADAGLVQYGFVGGNVYTRVRVIPHNDKAASVEVRTRLGRCYTQYPRALRWLAANRSGNSVASDIGTEAHGRNELWVYAHRITLPSDAEGIRLMVLDCADEVSRVLQGLAWFPHMLDGEDLTRYEQLEDESAREFMEAVLGDPRGYCQWVTQNPEESIKAHLTIPMKVFGWLGRWQESLDWMERHWQTMSREEQEENKTGYLTCRVVTTCRLGKFREGLFFMDELEPQLDDEENKRRILAWRMAALCRLGQHEEALEAARSAMYDDVMKVWYWRALAEASLQHYDKSVEHFFEYEQRMGTDIIARKNVFSLFPSDWKSKDTEEDAA